MPSILSHHGGLASTSFITLLSSPKIEEALSGGMGQETIRESVRVCNFFGIGSSGGLAVRGAEGWKERVEVKRPERGPSIILLPSDPGDLESCPGAAGAPAAP